MKMAVMITMQNSKTNHSHHHENPSGRLLISILLNGLITLVEIVGGVFSNSLALISDAIHNLSDTLALILAWLANNVSGRKPNARRTFGYKRFEILSAFINASVLTAISIYLVYEAILRFIHPEPVRSGLMLIIAVIGLGANLVSMLFLHRDSNKSLNIKAAYVQKQKFHITHTTLQVEFDVCGDKAMIKQP